MNSGKLLVISSQWPEPSTTAAGIRMWQLIGCFKEGGYDICFSYTGEKGKYAANLEAQGVRTRKILLNDASFDLWVAQWLPDIVLLDRFMMEEQFGWRVAKCCPDALRILDTEDLHSLRLAREAALTAEKAFTTALWLKHPCTLRELASIYRSDLSLIISPYEMQLLTETAGIDGSLLLQLPFMFQPVKGGTLTGYESRKGFICIGNGRHRPNTDAIRFLGNQLWPAIREKLPQAQLSVYGAYLPPEIQQLNNPERGLYIKGWAENIEEKLRRTRVQLAPLRYGAGIKGKLADSMRAGTPSVTTPIGAEGMNGPLPWGGIIAGSDSEFVQAAVTLHEDRQQWMRAQTRGCHIVNVLYGREGHQSRLLERVDSLRRKLQTHRDLNLIGAMMRHHRMASTRYLSQWIEVKRKLQDPGKTDY